MGVDSLKFGRFDEKISSTSVAYEAEAGLLYP